ncbi:uncharacterized protein [Linepithema humile]|uniref:uncharacterized protein isoform X2 n=1 Tax=Linepithema humile TaxID=83485 RepID=UPI00351F6CF0
MTPVDKEQYRLEQEAFVSNHGGTTPQDILLTLLPNVCGILLTTTTLGVLRKHIHRNVYTLIRGWSGAGEPRGLSRLSQTVTYYHDGVSRSLVAGRFTANYHTRV